MTLKELFRQKLIDNGLFKNMADDILKLAETDKVLEKTMANRWNDNKEGYPPFALAAIWLPIKRITLKYIDDNIPEAWFRNLFI